MKMAFKLFLALTLASALNLAHASCNDASITNLDSDGSALTLDDGSIWEVGPTDRIDSASWKAGDDVLACDDEYIIHKDDGKKVSAEKLSD